MECGGYNEQGGINSLIPPEIVNALCLNRVPHSVLYHFLIQMSDE